MSRKLVLLIILLVIAGQKGAAQTLPQLFHVHSFSNPGAGQFIGAIGNVKSFIPSAQNFHRLDTSVSSAVLFDFHYGMTDRLSIHFGTSTAIDLLSLDGAGDTAFGLFENLFIGGGYQWLGGSSLEMKQGQWGSAFRLIASLAVAGVHHEEYKNSKWRTFSRFPILRRIIKNIFISNTFGYMLTDELAFHLGGQMFMADRSLLYSPDEFDDKYPHGAKTRNFVYSDSFGFELFSGTRIKLSIIESKDLFYKLEFGLIKTTFFRESSRSFSESFVWIPKVYHSLSFYF